MMKGYARIPQHTREHPIARSADESSLSDEEEPAAVREQALKAIHIEQRRRGVPLDRLYEIPDPRIRAAKIAREEDPANKKRDSEN